MGVINYLKTTATSFRSLFCGLVIITTGNIFSANATVLPDERVDVLEHIYEGGGVQVSGPSILVRKNIGSAVSVSANYYIDMVSSASIDVLASASRYSEKRIEKSIGAEYIHDRTTFSLGNTTSLEGDYEASTYSLGVGQAFFGDLTTLGFGVSIGQDIVGQNTKEGGSSGLALDKDRRKYSLSLSQIMTKNLILEASLEAGSDACVNMQEGESCLNNPYRQVRYLSGTGFASQAEKYPLTHNTDAIGLRAIYHLPFSASIRGDIRQFSDSWGIKASNAEVRYTHDFKKDLLIEIKYRVYSQTAADFYSDLFPYRDAQNFLARDKELSPFSSQSIGLGATYKFPFTLPGFEKSTANLYWDHMTINYDDFRDYKGFAHKVPEGGYKAGEEPLYNLDADVIRLYLSFWF